MLEPHSQSNEEHLGVKAISVNFQDIPVELIDEEKFRNFTEDDFYWVLVAEIKFETNESRLCIEAPVFYFTDRLIQILKMKEPAVVSIKDTYDSYKLLVKFDGDILDIVDEYGNGRILTTMQSMQTKYFEALLSGLSILVDKYPELSTSELYNSITTRILTKLRKVIR